MARKAAIHFVRPLRRRILSTSSRGRSFFTLHKEAEMGRSEPADGRGGGGGGRGGGGQWRSGQEIWNKLRGKMGGGGGEAEAVGGGEDRGVQ